MPSILTEEDKQTVKRTVPKASNKIQAVAVAKLYIAYPDRARWTYTGLQGAAVLANDLVGNTFWVKLVDVSPANRGVIWDQEIYENWAWNQDRTFFHTFELDDGRGGSCLAGLSFADEKEAKQFRKKMEEREKNASKGTRTKAFAMGGGQTQYQQVPQQKSHGRFGGFFSRGRGDSNPQQPAQSIIPPRGVEIHSPAPASPAAVPVTAGTADIDLSDPAVKAVLADLLEMGITEDQIHEHSAFIKSYLEQNKATAAAQAEKQERAARAPPPPPPVQAANLSPQNTGSSKGGRGPPPAPPPSRRTATGTVQKPPSPSPSPPREPSPPRSRFRVPPPLANAGTLVNNSPSLPNRQRAASQSNAAPPPPPRVPAKVPIEDDSSPQPSPGRFAVPPPFEGKRIASNPGPPPPPRGSAGPPPPPPRDSGPPPAPPRTPQIGESGPPAPPPLPPSTSRPVPPAPAVNGSGPPAPPPLPPTSNVAPPPLPPTSNVAPPPPPPPMPVSSPGGPPPPPPPMPSSNGGGPPPPPPMPPRGVAAPSTDIGVGDDTAAAAQSGVAPPPGRGGLLADIRGGARLKKVSEQEKRDRSAAAVPGSEPAAGSSAPGGGSEAGAAGGLAGALASALAVRKSKVSHSDDEKSDDEW